MATEFSSTNICVLVIDSNVESLFHTAELLHSCNCTVMAVTDAINARWKLLKEKDNIDFVMSDVRTPGLNVFTLLKMTSEMKLRTIITCPRKDPNMVLLGLDVGAFMVLEKPLCWHTIETLWQHVRRDLVLKRQALLAPLTPLFRNMSLASSRTPIFEGIGSYGSADPKGKAPLQDYENFGCKRKKRSKEDIPKAQETVAVEWTQELQDKFMAAVSTLGEGYCDAKDVWELMNVPGLTRTQVSAHLQKLRKLRSRARSNSRGYTFKRSGALPLPINMPDHYQTNTPNMALSRGASSSEGLRPPFHMSGQITASHLANIFNDMQFGPPPGFPMHSSFAPILSDIPFGPAPGFRDLHEFPPAVANSMQRNAANGSGLPDLNEGGSFPTILPRVEPLAAPKPEPQSDDDDVVYIYDGAPRGSSSDPSSTQHRYVPGGSSTYNVKKEP